MRAQNIQGYSYQDRQTLLPALAAAITYNGGWVLDRKVLSPVSVEFRVEVEIRAIVDIYAAIIAAGLELTRSGHLMLTELCTCRRHLAGIELSHVVAINIDISFLEEVTLHSLLGTGSALA